MRYTLRKFTVISLLLFFYSLINIEIITGDETVQCSPEQPALELTFIPKYGTTKKLKGRVYNVKPKDHRIAVYINVAGGWWTKPTFANPVCKINKSEKWKCKVVTGGSDQNATQFAVFLIHKDYTPPQMQGNSTLPQELFDNAKAYIEVTRQPELGFESVPPHGVLNKKKIKGWADVNLKEKKIAVYIYIPDTGWLKKPNTCELKKKKWKCEVVTDDGDQCATEIVAFLLPKDYDPPLISGESTIPCELYENSDSFVKTKHKQTSKTISFSGYEWTVKSSDTTQVGPGPNYFSDSLENVCIDKNGRLHLKITKRGEKWYAAEVVSKKSFGYGKYTFYLASRVDQINENAVVGLFTWDDAPDDNHREIDIEFSRWGDASNENSQYVVQPWDQVGNMYRFNTVLNEDKSAHSFAWSDSRIFFQSFQNNGDIIEQWCYAKEERIPKPGNENARINLWLDEGKPPSDGKEVELIVEKFEFSELNNDSPCVIDFSTLPEITQTNISTFFVASTTEPDNNVKLNGSPLPPSAMDGEGNFAVSVHLTNGQNLLKLEIESEDGENIKTIEKTVNFNEDLSTGGKKLIYIDSVDLDNDVPALPGTIVIDLNENTFLGLIENKHVVGISPDGSEIYMSDRTVINTDTHRELRTLPFTQDIPGNGFIVSPDGTRLYSRNERVEVSSNTLIENLPIDIVTGSSWAIAPIPGGPTISADGRKIYCGNDIKIIDTVEDTAIETNISGHFMSDIALSPDGSKILVSEYSSAQGRLDVYDAHTFEQIPDGTISGLGDFTGEIEFSNDGQFVVVGSSGNPVSAINGQVTVINLDELKVISQINVPLADNLTTSGNNEFFISSGSMPGIDIYVLESNGSLVKKQTFFLGINNFKASMGKPESDQIRRIIFKPI